MVNHCSINMVKPCLTIVKTNHASPILQKCQNHGKAWFNHGLPCYSMVLQIWFSMVKHGLKQQNRYLFVIMVCGYFSSIRSFIRLNLPSKSNSYHNTGLSMSFGCWHLSGIPLCPLHFTVYTIAWQRKFEPQWVFNINLCILSGKRWHASHFHYVYTKK